MMNAETQEVQDYQVLDEELIRRIKEEVRKYTDRRAFGVVHVRGSIEDPEVVVDDRLVFDDNEVAYVFLNRGQYYVVINSNVDETIVEAVGDADQVRRRMDEIHDEAERMLSNYPEPAEFMLFLTEVFFVVDEALAGDP